MEGARNHYISKKRENFYMGVIFHVFYCIAFFVKIFPKPK